MVPADEASIKFISLAVAVRPRFTNAPDLLLAPVPPRLIGTLPAVIA